MFCHNCATKIEDGENFCRNCGEMSVSIAAYDNEVNWFKRSGLFLLGIFSFCIFLLILTFLIETFLPSWKSPQMSILILFVSGVLLSGLTSVLLTEKKRIKKKTAETRKKKQFVVPKNEPLILEEKTFEAVPFSVTEYTTKELIHKKH